MALTDVPSIKTIRDRIVADVESKINQDVPAYSLSFVRVVAGAFAVAFYLLYQLTAWVYKQIFTQTQDIEALKLDGESKGILYRNATYGVLSATVNTSDGLPGSINSGNTFYGSNDVVYRVNSTTEIPGAVAMTALTSGKVGNLTAGDEITLSSSAPGVAPVATVILMTLTADDDEDIENYRERVAIRKRTKFIYGSPAGYALSGLETPNFIWVGPYADPLFAGNVNVYGRVSLDLGTNGIPTSAQLLELENFLKYDNGVGDETRKPTTDTLVVLPIQNNEFDIIVSVQNVSLALKTDIENAIIEKVASYEPFIAGVSQVRNDTMTNTDIAIIGDTVATPDGGKVVSVTLFDVTGGAYFNSFTFFGGVFGKARNISFIDIV